jgi:hypothetical protein
MLAQNGMKPEDIDKLAIGAFSAGGSLVKRVLMHPEDRKHVTAVHLADATYTSAWENAATRRPPPIEGFVRYALDAIDGPHLLVATASPIWNKSWASGVENLQRLREEVETRSGKQFQKLDNFYDIDPQPDAAYQLGNVVLAEYPYNPLGHGHTKIAGQVWDKIVNPWLMSDLPGPWPDKPPPPAPDLDIHESEISPWTGLGIMAGGAVIGYLGLKEIIGRVR